jgi:hypothetical protein
MIKINYKQPEESETKDDIAQYNIKICDQCKKADYLELSCISWLKIDSNRNYQDLEELLRFMNLDSYVIAQTISNIPQGLEIGKPNKSTDLDESTNANNQTQLEYIAIITCMGKEDSMKELLKHHTSYEENFECLKKAGCIMAIKQETSKEDEEKISQTQGVEEVKKLLGCELKLDLEMYKPMDSINYIINDLVNKYDREPEKVICGEIGKNKVWALMLDGQIISPIGWIEKYINQENKEKQETKMIDYELIDFRKIKIEKA